MKRFGIAGLLIVGLLVLAYAFLPRLLSAQTVTAAVEKELSRVTGYPVSLNGNAELSVRPYLGLRYTNVTIGDDGGAKPLLTIDQLDVSLNATSVLLGAPTIKTVKLVRPSLRLALDQAGNLIWNRSGLAGSDSRDRINTAGIGTVSIEDGMITYVDGGKNIKETITALSGTLSWPRDSTAADAKLAGIWNGEAFSTELSADNTTALLGEGSSGVAVLVNGPAAQLSYSGNVAKSADIMLDGSFNLSSSSPLRLTQWLKRPLPAASLVDKLSLRGQLTGALSKLILSDVSAIIGKASGEGRLSFEIEKSLIGIHGTLAFDAISLPSLAELGQPAGATLPDGSKSLADGLAVDVRLSAEQASSGPVTMEDLAASLFIKDGKALFDIGQATAFGGQVAGTFQPRISQTTGFSADLKLTDINLQTLSGLYGDTAISIDGRGDAKFKLESQTPADATFLTRLNGSGSISSVDGQILGIDLTKATASIDEPEKIRSSDVFSGATPYDAINIGFYIANGLAFFQDTELKMENVNVNLSGRSDLSERSLALQGRLLKAKPNNDESEVATSVSMPFLIGGTISAPLFIALPANLQNAGPPNVIPTVPAEN